jgi:5-methylcytosine-specific restriction endonuclease McrA
MADDISQSLRRVVAERAGFRCEYCLMPEVELFAGCEVDHIISRKHGGLTDSANPALSCERCNRAKGNGRRLDFRRGATIRALVQPAH